MNIEELREYCIAKPFVKETFPFDEATLVFKVLGKAFLLTDIYESPVQFNVKCDPERAIELREKFSFVLPGYHMNKKHWNTVICENGATKKLLKEFIDHSYEMVVKGLPVKDREKVKKASR
jgi:predicted DNA-binding protein (MmcQ/YjbR family)